MDRRNAQETRGQARDLLCIAIFLRPCRVGCRFMMLEPACKAMNQAKVPEQIENTRTHEEEKMRENKSHQTTREPRKLFRSPALFVGIVLLLTNASAAFAALTVTPITWDIIGLDSNRPTSGPKYFPVGARICTDQVETSVTATFKLLTSKTATNYINAEGETTLTFAPVGGIAAGTCKDAYFEVGVDQVAGAYTDYRAYTITALGASGASGSTPEPR